MDLIFGYKSIKKSNQSDITVLRELERFTVTNSKKECYAEVIISHKIGKFGDEVMYSGDIKFYDSIIDIGNPDKIIGHRMLNYPSVASIINKAINSAENYSRKVSNS